MNQPYQVQYTYGFARMALRDQVVFKSIVGLLSGRTLASWAYVDGPADLLVEGEEGEPRVQLRTAEGEPLWVHWPLRASEVFDCLERAARAIGHRPVETPGGALRLKHWPAASLLKGEHRYVRLATLLCARAMSLDELCERSGVPRQVAESFVRLMDAQQMLQPVEAMPAAPAQQTAAPIGLLARIRRHLGLGGTAEASR
ncbi:hypothetical protein [Pseudomonas sp. PDM22]|uniref:hypothetical protein n=1 Tax=Pseudomonas sp. PDM22 TaxID=2769287 RepID=UPI0009DA0A1B|nr:hypothetical protein [Pseudomonas sp. PDM22]MBD9516641.1 hypothetical protein [Pseudomonas sp. PDM22]OQR35946.1 hypothetical protein BWR15_06350 [Pseudomonas sp. T]